jgi:hypothetical protein
MSAFFQLAFYININFSTFQVLALWAELGMRFVLAFTLSPLRSRAEPSTLALLRSFWGLKFRSFAFALLAFSRLYLSRS